MPWPDNIKTPSKTSAVKMNRAAVAKTGTPEHANGTKPLRGATRINRNVEVVTESNKFRTPGNTNSAPILNKASTEKNITFNTKQIAVQKIQVKSQVTFEKLIIPFPSNSNFPPVQDYTHRYIFLTISQFQKGQNLSKLQVGIL